MNDLLIVQVFYYNSFPYEFQQSIDDDDAMHDNKDFEEEENIVFNLLETDNLKFVHLKILLNTNKHYFLNIILN